jgi:Nucleotidyltransferase of unknown function (DUF6036)
VTGSGEGRFLDALRAVRDGLEQLDLPWVIIGGVAVIARGVPRFTADIDATVWVGTVDPERILDVLGRQQLAPRIEHAAAFAREHQVLLLRHTPSGVPLDVSLAALPFEQEAIQLGQECDYAGVQIRVARAEDLVVYKLVAARPRDLDDAEKLLSLHGPALDIARIGRLVREFSDALEDSSRVETFERLLRKAGQGR